MRTTTRVFVLGACAVLLLTGTVGWAQTCPATGEFWFWRLGHMDGPHDSSKALGISRDAKTAVGATVVVDFQRAWRCYIDWAVCTDDQMPPLYNELQVQEDIGFIAPSEPSAAYASSDMSTDPAGYDLPNLQLDWGGSMPVGTITGGTVSYGIEWLLPVLDGWTEDEFIKVQDFGGGASEMVFTDVSTDGLTVVGYGNIRKGPVAFRADMTDPLLPVVQQLTITDSVYTAQTLKWTKAEAMLVTSTGQEFIAGYGGTKTGTRAFVTEVLDTTTDPVTLLSVVLPNIPGGKFAEAYAMVEAGEHGVVVAGRSDSPKGPQACIWWYDDTTAAWVVKGIGGLSKKKLDSVATGIVYRADPDVGDLLVVGRSASILYDSEALVWSGNPVVEDDEIGYLYDLEYILIKTGVAEASACGSEWILNAATGVAIDTVSGTARMVGWGTNPEGGIEAWLVTGFPTGILEFTHD